MGWLDRYREIIENQIAITDILFSELRNSAGAFDVAITFDDSSDTLQTVKNRMK